MSALTNLSRRVGPGWRAFETWTGTRRSAVVLFGVALFVFSLQSIVLPVYEGRDMAWYVQAFLQLWYDEPVLPRALSARGPLAAIGVGVPLELGGWAVVTSLGVLYAASIVAWTRVARVFGPRTAILTAVLLLVYPGYGILFHELASDSLFAAGFAGWAVLVARVIPQPSKQAFALVGVATGALVLIRPPNLVLAVVAFLPLLLRAPWERRFAWVAACLIPCVAVTQGWKALMQLRFGEAVSLRPSGAAVAAALLLTPLLFPAPWRRRAAVAVALMGVGLLAVNGDIARHPVRHAQAALEMPSSHVFLYRAYIDARIVRPDNGPASRYLARVAERELLAEEPYRSYGVDLDEFFSSGSDRILHDIYQLDRVDTARVAREAIDRHRGAFARSVARTLWADVWTLRMYVPPGAAGEESDDTGEGGAATDRSGATSLPEPTEGQPIPASRFGRDVWTLEGGAREVWMPGGEHPLVFDSPRDERRYEKFKDETSRLLDRIDTYGGDPEAIHRLNQVSKAFPPPLVWLLLGGIGLAIRRPRHALVAIAPAGAGLVLILSISFVAVAVAQYVAPVTPAFLLLAAAGLLGTRGDHSRRA